MQFLDQRDDGFEAAFARLIERGGEADAEVDGAVAGSWTTSASAGWRRCWS